MLGIDKLRIFNLAMVSGELWSKRYLIAQFTIREFQRRYRRTMLGFFWGLVLPLIMLAVYTFVFAIIFEAKWDGLGSQTRGMFAIVLFANLLIFGIFSEVVSGSTTVVVGNSNLVKKVIFPLEILPISRALACFIQTVMNLVVLLIGICLVGAFNWTVLLAPLVMLPVLILAMGVSFFTSSVTVFIRDVGELVGVCLTLLLFLSPIFYPLSRVPEGLRIFIYINPLAIFLEQFRIVMIEGGLPNWGILALCWVVALGIFAVGYAWFNKVKGSFADVL